MKKLLSYCVLAGFFCLLFASCKKHEFTCHTATYYINPVGIAFKGYQASDLDTIIRMRYSDSIAPGTLQGTDTFLFSPDTLLFVNDAVYLKRPPSNNPQIKPRYFFLVKNKMAYRIILPSVNREYTITGTISKTATSQHLVNDKDDCPREHPVLSMTNTHVNGVLVSPYRPNFDFYDGYIYLVK